MDIRGWPWAFAETSLALPAKGMEVIPGCLIPIWFPTFRKNRQMPC